MTYHVTVLIIKNGRGTNEKSVMKLVRMSVLASKLTFLLISLRSFDFWHLFVPRPVLMIEKVT